MSQDGAHEQPMQYDTWSKEDLVQKIAQLELALASRAPSRSSGPSKPHKASTSPPARGEKADAPRRATPDRPARTFDAEKLPCRKIALRFSYDGTPFSGLATSSALTPEDASAYLAGGAFHRGEIPRSSADHQRPSVEAVLWAALVQARLVNEAGGMFKAGWSRCGRTDRGVSAAGQVVALWVRSRRVNERALKEWEEAVRDGRMKDKEARELLASAPTPSSPPSSTPPVHSARQALSRPPPERILLDDHDSELSYVNMLNRLLPPQIRIQAWSPVRANFSARFDCRYRHYKYFFNEGVPASLYPTASTSIPISPRLDIGAMRAGAARMLGAHDFRHLCKVDASKQLTHFNRRVDGVSIDRVGSGWPTLGAEQKMHAGEQSKADEEGLYVLNLRGTAFLYHQVRHMMAVLLLIGARLESPSVVDELLNIEPGAVRRNWEGLGDRRVDHPLTSEESGADAATVLPNSTATARDGITASMGLALLRHQAASRLAGSEDLIPDDFDVSSLALPEPGNAHTPLSPQAQRALERVEETYVYSTKPSYEMASDAPLVLWDCGFRECDIQWRAGGWDGWEASSEDLELDMGAATAQAFPPSILRPAAPSHAVQAGSAEALAAQEADWDIASRTVAGLHAEWVGKAIEAEMARHFVLSAPGPRSGRLRAGRSFEEARWPYFHASPRETDAQEGEEAPPVPLPRSFPIGGGIMRPAQSYVPLRRRPRDDTAQEKNLRWKEGRGKRRAERKGCEAEELAKGGSVRQ